MGEILTRQQLIAKTADARADGRTIAFANGCFDLLHVGHIRYLESAAQEADVLVVAVNDDASVATLKVLHDHGASHKTFVTYKVIALIAVAYCLWAVVGGDPKTVVHALVALLISVPLYPFFMRSMAQARDRKLAMKREKSNA